MPLHFDWEHRTASFKGLSTREKLSRQDAQKTADILRTYFQVAKRANMAAQKRMVRQANKHRREPDFDVGDYVYIIKKSWSTDRPSDKLDFPMIRNFHIASWPREVMPSKSMCHRDGV